MIRVDNSTGKGTSSMDKFSSKVHRVRMELGGKLLNSLRIETQFFAGSLESNGGSLEAPAAFSSWF